MPRSPRPSAAADAGPTIKQKAVISMLWVGGTRLASRFFDQIFTIILARLLLPGDFGIIAMVSVFTRAFNLLTYMGLSQAVIQRNKVDDKYLSTAFWANLVSGAVLGAVGVGVSGLLARLYGQPQVGPVFAAISLRFVFGGATAVPGALLARNMRFAVSERRDALSHAVGGIVGVGLAISGGGVWSLVGQNVATDFVKMILIWLATAWRPRRVFLWDQFKEMWAFGSRFLAAQFFNYVVKYSDNLLVGRALGAVLLGYYSFAYALFLSPLIEISLTVGRVTFSALSRLQDDVERFRRGFLMTTVYVAFVAVPALLGLYLVVPDLILVVFSAKWMPAAPVLRILLIAGLFQCQALIWNTAFPAAGRIDWFLRWSIFSAFVYVPAFYFGLRWGITGVATGYTVVTVLLIPMQFALVQRIVGFRVRDYLKGIWPVAAATAAMAGGVIAAQGWLTGPEAEPIVRLVAAIGVGIPTYLLATLVFQRRLITELAGTLLTARRYERGGRRLAEEVVGS